jgi:hypothetical protein
VRGCMCVTEACGWGAGSSGASSARRPLRMVPAVLAAASAAKDMIVGVRQGEAVMTLLHLSIQ